MGIIARQSIWNTALLYAGVLIGYVNVVMLFPRILGDEAYGLTRIILSIVFIGMQFALLGTPSILMRYFPGFQEGKKPGLIPFALSIMGIGSLLVTAALVLFKEPIISFKVEDSALLSEYYYLSIPILLSMTFYMFFTALCRVHLVTTLPVFVYEFLFKFITAGLLIGTWYFGWSLSFFLGCWTLSYAFNAIVLVMHLIRKKRFDLRWNPSLGRPFVKESLDFGLFNMMSGASNSIISNVDILMIGLLLTTQSLESAGVYAIMVYIGNTILMPGKGLGTIATPLISQFFERSEKQKMQDLYERTSLNQTVVSGFIFLALFINLENMLDVLQLNNDQAGQVFILIGLARLAQTGTGVNGVIINYSPYYRWTTYFILMLSIVAIISNYLLIPIYGITGAALASFISIMGFEFLKWAFVKVKLGLQPFKSGHLKAVLVAALLVLINHYLPRLEGWLWWDVLYRSSIFASLCLLALLTMNIAPDLRDVVKRNLAKIGITIP